MEENTTNNKLYKIVKDDVLSYLVASDEYPMYGIEITQDEWDTLTEEIKNRQEPEPEPKYTLDEAAAIIASEVADNE